MLTKRLIVCLDVRNRKVTKGVKFKGNIDIGDPVEMGAQYSADGVDELALSFHSSVSSLRALIACRR